MAVDILPKEVRVAIIIAQKSGSQFSKKRES